ncbi:ribosome-binding factor A [Patescibacteria group bacterium]|nr:ribosome-binding factor A [Patescibacteria group bacterium]
MNAIKEERVKELIRHKASEFLKKESAGKGLITVTRVRLADKGTKAVILFTVFPTEEESAAVNFAKRKRSEFREYLRQETKLFQLPFIDFNIDLGEKNRQKIDALSKK